MPPLPYEQPSSKRYFPSARIYAITLPNQYVIANLAKGGVVKVFDRHTGALVFNDCGIIGRMDTGQVVTSQWVDPSYVCQADDMGWEVGGHMNAVPSNKLFSPLKTIVFRAALIALGWSPRLSHMLKGRIRKSLMLGQRPVPIRFRRQIRIEDGMITLEDELRLEGSRRLASLSVGDEFFVRYVPQSRYFQSQELDVQGNPLTAEQLATLNQHRRITLRQQVPLTEPAHRGA